MNKGDMFPEAGGFLDLMRAEGAGEKEAAKAFAACVKQSKHLPTRLNAAIAITKIFNLMSDHIKLSATEDLIEALQAAKEKARGGNESE